MATGELSSAAYRTPDWVDDLYRLKIEQGFIPKGVVILPDIPVGRTLKEYELGVFDYDGEMLPYPTLADAQVAKHAIERIRELRQIYGAKNVDSIPLPSGFEPIDNYYRLREHRLMIVNPSTVNWWIENALSADGSMSPSDVAPPANTDGTLAA